MNNTVDFLIIDGQRFNVGVLSGIKETIDILDRYANRTQDGVLHREIIGTYKNYSSIKFAEQTDANYDAYENLWETLGAKQEFHTITIANYTFSAYISSISREIAYYSNGRAYHKKMECKFTSERPYRS